MADNVRWPYPVFRLVLPKFAVTAVDGGSQFVRIARVLRPADTIWIGFAIKTYHIRTHVNEDTGANVRALTVRFECTPFRFLRD